jgi:hypothetical protein
MNAPFASVTKGGGKKKKKKKATKDQAGTQSLGKYVFALFSQSFTQSFESTGTQLKPSVNAMQQSDLLNVFIGGQKHGHVSQHYWSISVRGVVVLCPFCNQFRSCIHEISTRVN